MLDKKTYQLLQGSTLLDEKLFNQKKNFFYNTSYDILIKGECGNSASTLEIFKAIRKKAKIKPEENQTTNIIQHKEPSRNKSKSKQIAAAYTPHRSNGCNSTSKFRTLFASQSTSNINKSLLSFRMSKSLRKSRNCFSDSFRKSNSMVYMGNSMGSHKLFIKCLDDKISKLDIEIERMNKEEIFKVPFKFSNDQRTKVLTLLRDYFPKKAFNIMQERYNKLFGNEPYFNKIKKIKSRISLDSIKLNHRYKNGKIDKDEENKFSYLQVVNGGSLYNRKVVSNKYDSIGKVKILNIPKDFYNDITGINDEYSIGASNVKKMYSMMDQKEQKIMHFANHYYYSREKKYGFNDKLNEINDKFSQVEKDGKTIKNNILKLKSFLNDKSPLISDKIFAYIDDSPKGKTKINQSRNKKGEESKSEIMKVKNI